jgi:hypothetical protein
MISNVTAGMELQARLAEEIAEGKFKHIRLGNTGAGEVYLRLGSRGSTADVGPDDELWVGGGKIVLGRRLDGRLEKLLPRAYGKAELTTTDGWMRAPRSRSVS